MIIRFSSERGTSNITAKTILKRKQELSLNVDSDKDNFNISCKKFDHFVKTKHMMLHKLMCP